MNKEAMKLALEALESVGSFNPEIWGEVDRAKAALREALAEQPEQQEPFGYFRYDLRLDAWVQNRAGLTGTPFYTSQPAQRTWVGLTEADWKHLYDEFAMGQELDEFAEAIEAKLKEKNT